ncbi:MAG TPA: Holliday junction branch migration protein RuvA [Prolixibacteraceae bacterium]|nr:Holliday junction branch migration protein RuvA [Prolixibacteraceae bacterium]
MYEFIRGEIAELNPATVVVETAGVGYSIRISLNTYTLLNGLKEARLFTHLIVRDDAHLLYGFAHAGEREIFRNLLSVNGVGAATAMMLLSTLSPDEIIAAVSSENVALLKTVKGIGVKTAQRIIIDLKDKLGKASGAEQILIPANNTIPNEALSALVMLGFAKKEAEAAVSKILKDDPQSSVENVIKQALKRL